MSGAAGQEIYNGKGGGGGGSSQTSTGIDPMLKPYVTYGLTEAQKLYQSQNPQYYPGQTYVSPSAATQAALQAQQTRALQGNPLIPAAQANLKNLQTATNVANPMYSSIYSNAQTSPAIANAVYGGLASGAINNPAMGAYIDLYGNAQTNPQAAQNVYSNLAAGNITNAANPYNQFTAGGGFLGANPYFTNALAGAGQATTQNYWDAINQAQSGASQAGRYGSGAQANLFNRAGTTLANTLANKAGELAYNQYAAERGLQEAAMGRLGSVSAQDIANQLAGAQNLTQAGQQTYANQLAAAGGLGTLGQQAIQNQLTGAQQLTNVGQQALQNQLAAAGGLAGTSAADLSRQLAAGQAAPALAAADYGDIQQLANVGQQQEAYQQSALEDAINRYNFEQNLPQNKLNQFLSQVAGVPAGTTSTTTQSSGGKIVCTMMNESYGIGSFRNRVWLAHSASMPDAKTYEKGYHTLFLPLVAFAKKDGFLNRAVKSVLEHIAKHRTADLYKEMRGNKRDTLGRIYRAILEPICYAVGKMKGY